MFVLIEPSCSRALFSAAFEKSVEDVKGAFEGAAAWFWHPD